MSPKTDLKNIKSLENSNGWKTLRRVMEAEIVTAAMQIADNPNMEINEINFRRGAIWAANRMLEMPLRLTTKLEAEIALDKDDSTKPLD